MTQPQKSSFRVGIIGGGVAGSIAALKLNQLGIEHVLFESKSSLISGPPICHLHAGGNLYREISEQQCIDLLEQSIDTIRAFPQVINPRPTVIALPLQERGSLNDMLSRLQHLQAHYQWLVSRDPKNQVLGKPEDYFRVYSQQQLEQLAQQETPRQTKDLDDWMIPVAKSLDLDVFQYPMILVQEYGFSVFRMAALAELSLQNANYCQLKLNTQVHEIKEIESGWEVICKDAAGKITQDCVDFLVNAAGFQTGTLDDFVKQPRQRLVEYKAAYIAQWQDQSYWPEIIVHGARGTPQGMAQFTPYANGFVQLHGMTEEITLFKDGLASSTSQTAQPQLPDHLLSKVYQGWSEQELSTRTERAIAHFSRWMPDFSAATVAGKPLCGAQQIPGEDASLRAAGASFPLPRYARIELVKASSGLSSIVQIIEHIKSQGWVELSVDWHRHDQLFGDDAAMANLCDYAIELTARRDYPKELALPYPRNFI